MSTQAKAIVDKLLTNVSNMLIPEGYISEKILPEMKVKQTTGKVGKYGNDHLRVIDTTVGGKGEYPVIDTITRSSTNYELKDHALKEILVEDDFDNVEAPFDARQDSVIALTTHLWIEKEVGLATTLSDTAIITQNVTLAGTDQWSDYANSNPIEDLRDARKAVRNGCGKKANMAFMDENVADVLRFHPQLLDNLGFKFNRAGGITDAELSMALKAEVIVAEAVYQTGRQGAGSAGALAPVWGNHMWYAHSPKTASRRQLALGYRMQKAGQSPRQVFKFKQEEPINSEKIIVKDKYQQLLTNDKCAYLIKNAIA